MLSVAGLAWGVAPMMVNPNSQVRCRLYAAHITLMCDAPSAPFMVEPWCLNPCADVTCFRTTDLCDQLRGHQRILMVQWPNRVSSN